MPIPRPRNENRRLQALQRYRILDTPAESSFDDFAALASLICQTPIALMTLVDENRQWFKARIGMEVPETPREHAFCSYTIIGDDPLIVNDAQADERFAQNPLVTAEPHIRFYAGAPLIDSEGNALGSLCVIDRRPRELTSEQVQALQLIARRAIGHIEVRNAAEQLAKTLEEVKTLSGLLPICSHCKSIRDDEGYWQRVETYVLARSDAEFSHGVCPPCIEEHYPDFAATLRAKRTVQSSVTRLACNVSTHQSK